MKRHGLSLAVLTILMTQAASALAHTLEQPYSFSIAAASQDALEVRYDITGRGFAFTSPEMAGTYIMVLYDVIIVDAATNVPWIEGSEIPFVRKKGSKKGSDTF